MSEAIDPAAERRMQLRFQAMQARLEPGQLEALLQATRQGLLKDEITDPAVKQLAGEYLDHLDTRQQTRAQRGEEFASVIGEEFDRSMPLGQLMFEAGQDIHTRYGDPFEVIRPRGDEDPLTSAAQTIGRVAVDGRNVAEVQLAEAYNTLYGSIE